LAPRLRRLASAGRPLAVAADPKAGAVDSHLRLTDAPHLNHRIDVVSGVLADECGAVMRAFFESRR